MPDDRLPDKPIETVLTDKQRSQSFDDLQNEIAGRETGRNARFLHRDREAVAFRKKRSSEDVIELTVLQQRLNDDPIYAEKYHDVLDLLDRVQSATEVAISKAEIELDTAQTDLNEMMDSANRLPDGTLVFQDEAGDVRTADGRVLSEEEREGIVWREGTPSYEDYIKQRQTVDDLIIQLDSLRTYQVDVLGAARDKVTDPDNPPSMDDLDQIEDDIRGKAPEVIRKQIEPETTPSSPDNGQSFDVDIPKL